MSTICPKWNVAPRKGSGFVLLLFISVAASAAGLSIEKGSVDLSKSETLSKPFTVLDQLLYSLEKEAVENAKHFRPEKNDFTPSTLHYSSAQVTYEKENLRVGVTFPVTVSRMNDPWRQVCEQHVRSMAQTLQMLSFGSNQSPEMVRALFSRYLGPKVFLENMPITSLRPFLDAVVVIVSFSVERADKKGLAYLRQCALEFKGNQVKYYEHKY